MATKNLTDLLSRQLGESASHFGLLHHSALPALSLTMAIPLGAHQLPPYSVELGVLRGVEIFSSQNALAASASVWITRWTRGSSNTAFIPNISRHLPPKKTLPLKRTQQVQGCKKKALLFSDCRDNNVRGYIFFHKRLMIVLAAGTSDASSRGSLISQRQKPAGM